MIQLQCGNIIPLLLDLGQNFLDCLSTHRDTQQYLLSLFPPELVDLRSFTRRQFISRINSRHWDCKYEQDRESFPLLCLYFPWARFISSLHQNHTNERTVTVPAKIVIFSPLLHFLQLFKCYTVKCFLEH